MIRIQVTSEVKPATKAGRPRNQVAYAYTFTKEGKAKPHPDEINIPLWDGETPYPEGNYAPAPQSFYRDKYDNLALSLRLAPVATR